MRRPRSFVSTHARYQKRPPGPQAPLVPLVPLVTQILFAFATPLADFPRFLRGVVG
jgi:hypothetical protein